MIKSNRDLCMEIINSLPEDQLSHIATYLTSIKVMSDELFTESKRKKLTEIYKEISASSSSEMSEETAHDIDIIDDLDSLAEKVGIKLKFKND